MLSTKYKLFAQMKDEEIIACIRTGADLVAQEYLLGKYKNFVRAKVRPYFLVGAETDDLIQEGMIGLYKAIRDYDPEKKKSFLGFADMCITGQVITALRAAQRLKHQPLNSYVSLDADDGDKSEREALYGMSAEGANPEMLLLRRESDKELHYFMEKKLSALEKRVLERYLTGLSYELIANELNMPRKSVDNALQRIRNKVGGMGKQG